jgi:hypothetical protein
MRRYPNELAFVMTFIVIFWRGEDDAFFLDVFRKMYEEFYIYGS